MKINTDIIDQYMLLNELNFIELKEFAKQLKIKNANKMNKEVLKQEIESKLK